MYISKELNGVSGANAATKLHLACIEHIVGKDNVYLADVSWNKPYETENAIADGKYQGKKEHLKRNFQLNTVYMSDRVIKDICEKIYEKSIDVVFIDDSIFGKLVKAIKKKYPKIYVITFYHDVKRNLYPQWLKEKGMSFLTECIAGIHNEKLNQKYSDVNITLNKRENDLYKKFYHKDSEYLLPVSVKDPGVPDVVFNRSSDSQKLRLLFVGKYYYPNVKGIKWFCEQVLTELDDNYELQIVGYGMEKIKDLPADDRIKLIGAVDDLNEVYRNADVIIGPIFDGAGMKVKTAEAFSYGKRFVGTNESLTGYETIIEGCGLTDKIIACNDADSFKEALKNAYKENISSFEEDIYRMYGNYFSEKACERVLRTILSASEV